MIDVPARQPRDAGGGQVGTGALDGLLAEMPAGLEFRTRQRGGSVVVGRVVPRRAEDARTDGGAVRYVLP